MADIDIVDFKLDVHLNQSTKLPRDIISFGNKVRLTMFYHLFSKKTGS